MTINKCAIPGEGPRPYAGGIRVGTPALTSRGFTEKEFTKVVEFLDRAIHIALDVQVSRTSLVLR